MFVNFLKLDNLQMFIFRVFYLTILFKKEQVDHKYNNIYRYLFLKNCTCVSTKLSLYLSNKLIFKI